MLLRNSSWRDPVANSKAEQGRIASPWRRLLMSDLWVPRKFTQRTMARSSLGRSRFSTEVLKACLSRLLCFSEAIAKLKSMEGIIDLLQRELELDFGYTDDEVVLQLTDCMDELKRNKLDVPASAENELPSKPFGLLYNPTVRQLRSHADSGTHSGRTSQVSSSIEEKVLNGHPVSPPMIMSGIDQKPLQGERTSRPSSRQLTHTPSVYDNVEYVLARNNKIKPTEPRSSSPRSGGDHPHISYVEVSPQGNDRILRHPVVETSEQISREFRYGPVRSRSGQQRKSAVSLQNKLDNPGEPVSPPRYGMPHEMELTIPSKTLGRDTANGGPTVIRIGY